MKIKPKSETNEKESNTSKLETSYLSENTKNHIEGKTSHDVSAFSKQLKSAPGIIYGVVDLAAGEKVSGVVALGKEAPNIISSKGDQISSNIHLAQSAISLGKDMKDLSATEKLEAISEYARFSIASYQDSIKNNQPKKENIADVVKAIGATSNKSAQPSDKKSKDDFEPSL